VGSRVNVITSAQSSAQTQQTNLQSSVSSLQDVDYAAAVTQLNTEEVSLQAAQESYASLAKLSLFNYLS
jgi:flagellar hook-associated protein 3 FlgL